MYAIWNQRRLADAQSLHTNGNNQAVLITSNSFDVVARKLHFLVRTNFNFLGVSASDVKVARRLIDVGVPKF